ncbi:hypothetical protein [Klebsiella phage vB_KpnS-VAC11]|uniref:Uncharacterized protein n=1 Tax=Klebsiella phage vB_KpnS-VAC11 TaxID=2864361 RepID=A0AAE7XK74_9CAUD|nr:hypothetical protein [Klebsiella phage vB_KpnS-VAC11]
MRGFPVRFFPPQSNPIKPHNHKATTIATCFDRFDRQIACMVHTFMQFVANHETLQKSLHRMKQSKAIMIRQN